MEVLSKDIIAIWMVPHLPFPAPGRARRAAPAEVVVAILYKLPGARRYLRVRPHLFLCLKFYARPPLYFFWRS